MIHHGDCLDVMAGMDPESVDAIVTDPPYGLEFMGKEWDRLGGDGWRAGGFGRPGIGDRPTAWTAHEDTANATCATCGGRMRGARKCECLEPDWRVKGQPAGKRNSGREQQEFHAHWAEAAYRVAKPSAYLLAFGGTRTVHRMTVALEDAGWIIRDMLVWGYASGFPKSKASLKPAWEPIVMARKPGPLRMLAIDECRIGEPPAERGGTRERVRGYVGIKSDDVVPANPPSEFGRWPANIVLSDEVFGAEYSRFFLIPKAARSDREPVLGGTMPLRHAKAYSGAEITGRPPGGERTGIPRTERENVHPTVKPVDLMRHLVRLVTPSGGVVLDPFLGSGTTALAAEMEGFPWIGIEREAEYVAIAEARLNGTQRGLGLDSA